MSAADIEAARHLLGPNVRWANLLAAPVIGLAFAAIPLARVFRRGLLNRETSVRPSAGLSAILAMDSAAVPYTRASSGADRLRMRHLRLIVGPCGGAVAVTILAILALPPVAAQLPG